MVHTIEMLAEANKVCTQATESEMVQQDERSNATEEAASVEQEMRNLMEGKEMVATENAIETKNVAETAASNEPQQWAKTMGLKATRVKAVIDSKEKTIIVAHTEYGMRHEKKMDKVFAKTDKNKLLTPRYHFCKPEIFWNEGYRLFNNNGEMIEQGTPDILVICDTPETSERIYFEDFLEDVEVHDFESVAEYAQQIGETIQICHIPSKVEEMGIAALATGDGAIKTGYEFAIDNNIPYTTALSFLDGEMKPAILKTMMRGITPKSVFTLGRTSEDAQRLYDAASATFEADCKKRYVPRALNSLQKKHGQSLETVIEALSCK